MSSEKKGRWYFVLSEIGSWLDEYGPMTANALGTFGLASAGVVVAVSKPFGLTILAISGVLYFFSIRSIYIREQLISHVRDENKELRHIVDSADGDYFEICTRHLISFWKYMDMHGNDRVRIYKYSDGTFVMLGRFAEVAELKARGRGIYQADYGVIGAAWRSADGCAFVDDLPDPETDLSGYLSESMNRFNMPREVTSGLRMKSRTLAAFVLKAWRSDERHAVIVFESLAPRRFEQHELDAAVSGTLGENLSLVLDILKAREPSPDFASAQGF